MMLLVDRACVGQLYLVLDTKLDLMSFNCRY